MPSIRDLFKKTNTQTGLGAGLNLNTWDNSGTFTTGVAFDGNDSKFIVPKVTTVARTAVTPLEAEIIYDSDEEVVYYGNGTTLGGVKVGASTLSDSVFRIQDNTDATKQIAFEASGITTGTTRTFTAPDASGTLVSTDTLTDKALYYYDAASKLFKPISVGTLGQTLIAQPASNPPYQWATPSSSSGGREVLTADRTYYVRTDGNDSNTGLTDTSGGAFATIQKAVDVVAGLDFSTYSVTIQLADGDYSSQPTVILKDPICVAGTLTIKGNASNSKAVKTPGFSATTVKKNPMLERLWIFPTSAFGVNAFSSELQLKDCVVSSEVNQASVVATDNSMVRILNSLEFDTTTRTSTYNYILVARSSIVNAASVAITKTGSGTTQDIDFVSDELSFLQLAYTTGSSFSSVARNRALVRKSDLSYLTA